MCDGEAARPGAYISSEEGRLQQACRALHVLYPFSNKRHCTGCEYEAECLVPVVAVWSLTAAADGANGCGKTISLCHALHYCYTQGWLVLHIPDGQFRNTQTRS